MAEQMEIDMMAPPVVIPNKVNVTGVSELSTEDLINFVNSKANTSLSEPVKVDWIDDNHCNLVFNLETEAAGFLELGSAEFEGAIGDEKQITVNDQTLIIRRGTDLDVKNPKHTWRESMYYKKKLEQKGINPDTFKPIVSRVILKPREGVQLPVKKSSPQKVSLIPRKLVNQAKREIFGDNAFSKNKQKSLDKHGMEVDEQELAKRQERGKRFSSSH